MQGIDLPYPRVDALLTDIFNSDDALIDYVQRLYGYALNGRTSENIFVLQLGKSGEISGPETLPLAAEVFFVSN
jgi:hypothetical protein